MTIAVIDIGSSSIRLSEVDAEGEILHTLRSPLTVTSNAFTETAYDAAEIAATVTALLDRTIERSGGAIEAIALANQRATSVVWNQDSLRPIGPALSWQDLRTAPMCLGLGQRGLHLAPNESATKFAWIIANHGQHVPRSSLRCGTLNTWVLQSLTRGEVFTCDASNAAMTGITDTLVTRYDSDVLAMLELDEHMLPAIVATHGNLGSYASGGRSLPITASLGDQQASMIGQGILQERAAKVTLGTGAMVDLYLGDQRPGFPRRGTHGSYPIVGWREDTETSWALEAAILSAGSSVDWFCRTLTRFCTPEEIEVLALSAHPSSNAIFVPALSGLATPTWDFGARGSFVNLTSETRSAEMARAVLLGIAHAVADGVEALEREASLEITELSADGQMARNDLFLQILADATGLIVRRSRHLEGTTIGAGLLGLHGGLYHEELPSLSRFHRVDRSFEPQWVRGSDHHGSARETWNRARTVALGQIPALSMVSF
ncbi:MAG: FGGY-family carbohydrate kinase [Acidimicrobiales bacterium]